MDDWWNLSTKQIIKRLTGQEPDNELVKAVDSLIETYQLEAWHFIYAIPVEDFWFVFNNYVPTLKPGDKLAGSKVRFFCEMSKGLSSGDRKAALAEFIPGGTDINYILTKYQARSAFDSAALDFLEGKVTSAKMYDWAVGQVMKQYPKKYDPKEVKEAIKQRWSY